MNTTARARRALFALGLTCAALCSTAAASYADGRVLPSDATPHGFSLADIAQATAQFVTSANSPSLYPRTPFQILYTSSQHATPDGDGLAITGANTFTVTPTAKFYVPILQADDSPPVTGAFPTAGGDAVRYFFDHSQLGVDGSAIVIDGDVTRVGPRYLVGPLDTAPLQDGGGTHELQLGAFLGRLEPGIHTVEVRTAVSGDAFRQATGLAFVHVDFTYTVNVGGR